MGASVRMAGPVDAGQLTDRGKMARLAAGESLWFDAPEIATRGTEADPPESRVRRSVLASDLTAFVKERDGVVATPVVIYDAIVVGELEWTAAVFRSRVIFWQCEFTDVADVSRAVFEQRCEFMRCVFARGLRAAGTRFAADLLLDRSTFTSPAFHEQKDNGTAADFGMAVVEGTASLCGAVFRGRTSFARVHAHGAFIAVCAEEKKQLLPARFEREVSFMDAHFAGLANFAGAQFLGRATFDRAEVGGSLFFRSDVGEGATQRALFAREAVFTAMRVQQDLEAQGAEFRGPALFMRMCVDGAALFNPDPAGNRVRFASRAWFTHVHFGGEASFNSVRFEGFANFYNSRVDGPLMFLPQPGKDGAPSRESSRVEFLGGARFEDVVVNGNANFRSALFVNVAQFVRFRVTGRADFSRVPEHESAAFEERTPIPAEFARDIGAYFFAARFGEVTFRACRFGLAAYFDAMCAEQWAGFPGAVFERDVSFRGASVGTVYFLDPDGDSGAAVFHGKLRLRGMTYASIYLPVEEIVGKLERETDRQVFLRLESTLRGMGDGAGSDYVYLAHRKYARARFRRDGDYLRWFGSHFYQLLTNSGVKPIRLVIVPALLLIFGAWAFHQPGSVERKPAGAASAAVEIVSWPRAFGISLNLFLPVEIPAGAKFEPTRAPFLGPLTYDAYATAHKLAGWLLVPLGVAAVTGMLSRKRVGASGGG